jgi:replication fork protection complex subunit Tof1/Swi1
MECLTELLLLLDNILSDDDGSEDFKEAAETLQHQLYYNGEILDNAFEGLKEWKDGGQMGFKYILRYQR